MDKDFVFLDRQGSRWRRVRILTLLLSLVAIVGGVIFVRELLIWPQLKLPAGVRDLKKKLHVVESVSTDPTLRVKAQPWLRFTSPQAQHRSYHPQGGKLASAASVEARIRAAVFVNGDAASLQSLKEHKDAITHVVPDWFSLTEMNLLPRENVDQGLLTFLEDKNIALMPQLTNFLGDQRMSDAVEALIRAQPERQDTFIHHLLAALQGIHAAGVVVNWQEIDAAYSAELTAFLQKLANGLHANHLELWMNIPVDDDLAAFNLAAMNDFIDHFIAELHRENSLEDPPGPLASPAWFTGWLHTILGYSEPEKWIISLGSYGYDWTKEKADGTQLSFADVMTRADHAGIGACTSGPPEYNPYFSYQTDRGETHFVWFLDASTFINQIAEVEQEGCGGIMIDQLGWEDPGIWKVLELPPPSLKTEATFEKIQEIQPGETLTHMGKGDFIEVDMATSLGERTFSKDGNGYVCVSYKKYPRYVTLYHQGAGKSHEVALTFDDGPSPYTSQILDILAQYHVPATFFLLGKQCEKYPKLVRRILKEGHTIGSHTYTHRNLNESSEEQTILELNATQRLLEWLTGKSTVLFRPPYHADSAPESIADVRPLALAGNMGYLNVCESVDLEDWERPSADVLLQRLRERRACGNVVLMHDGGGDRTSTVEALPGIIKYLQARGDKIVSANQLLGWSRDVLMPAAAQAGAKFPRIISNIGLLFYQWLEEFIWSFMVIATALLLLRTLMVAILAFLDKKWRSQQNQLLSQRKQISAVSVIIAAYNEGKVIQQTLASVLQTNFPGTLEVIVVDDGSQDDTAAKVAELAKHDSRIHLLEQENHGKAHALRYGLAVSQEEVVVFLDADTQFEPQTLPALLVPFAEKRVGAVSGHARVGNLRTWIARFQSLEYICGFNLDRRAYDRVNAITVVPGAISAFRKQAIVDAGGISGNTLAEDTDLTLHLHRAGWKVAYAPDAFAWTEAPETISTLVRQRFRWAFGTLQCLWKHTDMVFNGRYGMLGWFSLPSVWFFQMILVAAVPIIDVLLLISLFIGNGSVLIVYFFAFLITDFILAALACWLDGESLRKALYMIPMRFLYRPLLSYVVWLAIIRCLKGAWVGWGKLERKGNVHTPHATTS